MKYQNLISLFLLAVLLCAAKKKGSDHAVQTLLGRQFKLPQDAVDMFSKWYKKLTLTDSSVSFSSAVSKEEYVVNKVQRGLWPIEVCDNEVDCIHPFMLHLVMPRPSFSCRLFL